MEPQQLPLRSSSQTASKFSVGPTAEPSNGDYPSVEGSLRLDPLLKGAASSAARPLWQDSITGLTACWLLDEQHSVVGATPIATTSSKRWVLMGTGDFDNDGMPDILWRNTVTRGLGLWYLNGTMVREGGSLPTPSAGWDLQGVGDFDGNGTPDILWKNSSSGALAFWRLSGTSVTGAKAMATTGQSIDGNWAIRAVGDFWQDGRCDLVWQNTDTSAIHVDNWNGNGFEPPTYLKDFPNGSVVKGAEDFDGDGKADVLLRHPSTREVGYTSCTSANYTKMGPSNPNWNLMGSLPAPKPTFPVLARPALSVKPVHSCQIDLRWDPPFGATHTILERSVDGEKWTELTTLPSAQTDFSDTTIQASVSYAYRAKSHINEGLSASSQVFWAPAPRSTQNLPGTDWTYRVGGGWLNSVAHGAGVFIAVGDRGTVFRSTDGLHWCPQRGKTQQSLLSVAYGHGHFVAVGSNSATSGNPASLGGVVTSPDGVEWTPHNLPSTIGGLTALTFDGRRFLAAGIEGTIAISADGITWDITRAAIPGTTSTIQAITKFEDGYVAVGRNGTVLTSCDATTWTPQVIAPTGDLFGVSANHNTIVAVGEYGLIISSSDGIHWTSRSSGLASASFGSVFWDGQRFVAVGNSLDASSAISTSADGVTWTPGTGTVQTQFTSVTSGDGILVAVGVGLQNIGLSKNALDWNGLSLTPTFEDLTAVAYGAGVYCAVGNFGHVLTSADRITWTSRPLTPNNSGFNAIVYGQGVFLTVGPQNGAYSSVDGKTWTLASDWWPYDSYLKALAFGNQTFVAAGNSFISTSNDAGHTWVPRTTTSAQSIAFGPKGFIAVGYRIQRSSDGRSWETLSTQTPWLNGVTHALGQYVAVGERGTILTSIDGVNWTTQNSNSSLALTSVTGSSGMLIATSQEGPVLQSIDGIHWTESNIPNAQWLRASLFDGQSFTVVGDRGTIYTSP